MVRMYRKTERSPEEQAEIQEIRNAPKIGDITGELHLQREL